MKVIKRKIKAGEKGAKHLTEKYGDSLVCVRYIYDPQNSQCTKTVELVESVHTWIQNKNKIPYNYYKRRIK